MKLEHESNAVGKLLEILQGSESATLHNTDRISKRGEFTDVTKMPDVEPSCYWPKGFIHYNEIVTILETSTVL